MPTTPQASVPPTSEAVEFEVWRTHTRGGLDVRVLKGASEDRATDYLAECRADDTVRGFCEFYLVRVDLTRTRIDV